MDRCPRLRKQGFTRWRSLLALGLVSCGLVASVSAALALDNTPAELAIKKFLASQKTHHPALQVLGSAAADLNGDARPELVLLWSPVARGDSAISLTVLTQSIYGYSEAATISLPRGTRLVGVRDHLIVIDQKPPSAMTSGTSRPLRYRWLGGKIVQAD
jgi:hypothetical protein